MGHGLPKKSPFGTERIKIPITEFACSTIHLFYNWHHRTLSNVNYVILVLVKESDPKYQYCKEHMIEMDMKSNSILRLDFCQQKFEYCHLIEFSLWVEVFVVGDIPLAGIRHSWDNVIDAGRHQSRPHLPFDDSDEKVLVSDDDDSYYSPDDSYKFDPNYDSDPDRDSDPNYNFDPDYDFDRNHTVDPGHNLTPAMTLTQTTILTLKMILILTMILILAIILILTIIMTSDDSTSSYNQKIQL